MYYLWLSQLKNFKDIFQDTQIHFLVPFSVSKLYQSIALLKKVQAHQDCTILVVVVAFMLQQLIVRLEIGILKTPYVVLKQMDCAVPWSPGAV